MTHEELNYILSKNDKHSYAQDLINQLNRMTPENYNLFLTNYADMHLSVDTPPDEMYRCKPLTLVARALNQGRDIAFINSIAQNNYAEASRQEKIQDMQDKYVIHTGEENQGLQNSFFAQTANLKQEELPLQGWKFHISANDISDYYNLYSIVVPELDKLGVAFKTVKPEKFQQQLNSAQLGKALTIYPGPGFDINKLSEKAKSFLLSDSREHIVPNGDMKI